MLRLLRIIGIIVFAGLVGFSANSLWKMYQTGELLEGYSNAPQANMLLLAFSVIVLWTLGYFEASRARRGSRRRGSGKSHFHKEAVDSENGRAATSIYATSQVKDVWKTRRTRSLKTSHAERNMQTPQTPRRKKEHHVEAGMIWMRSLQIFSVILSVTYLVMLSLTLINGNEEAWVAVLLPTALGVLFLLSMLATLGIFKRKTWGMMLGYTLAVCNLLIFPYGTAVGLFLMMGLVGASPVFEVSAASDRRKKAQRKSTKRAQYSAV